MSMARHADRQQKREDLRITAHFREEPCTSVRRLCTRSTLGRAASENWQERRWCGLRISSGRWVVPPHSILTEDDVPDRPGGRSVNLRRLQSAGQHQGDHQRLERLAVLSGGSMRPRRLACIYVCSACGNDGCRLHTTKALQCRSSSVYSLFAVVSSTRPRVHAFRWNRSYTLIAGRQDL